MSNFRTLIGISLTAFILVCLYFECICILYIGFNLAIKYDAGYMWFVLKTNFFATSAFLLTMELFNYLLLQLYYWNAYLVIEIIIIAQVSDVYQYIGGTKFGRNKIGWISQNKTYEGYVIGWMLTVITFYLFGGFYKISAIYLLGVIGGLCSSLFKRLLCIKDYSNLLGPHGGWIDRIDSIILPLVVSWFGFF